MIKIFNSPGRYIQGPHAMKSIRDYLPNGKKCLLIVSDTAYSQWKQYINDCLSFLALTIVKFSGKECSITEISRIKEIGLKNCVDMIIAFGGGKVLDVSKAVAFKLNYLPLAIVPTIASCDAPTSASSVIYNDDGSFKEDWFYKKSPDIVLVDSTIIVSAPPRYLVAGMGDALSTKFEAEACVGSGSKAETGGYATELAIEMGNKCYKLLVQYGVIAKISVENKVVTPALEKVIEANILLSGLGFENSGLASAHGIHDGLTTIKEVRKCLHGEILAFCTIVQLILEGKPSALVQEVIEFCRSVGLPITLDELGIKENIQEKIHKATKSVNFKVVNNHSFEVTSSSIYNAIILADNIGKSTVKSIDKYTSKY